MNERSRQRLRRVSEAMGFVPKVVTLDELVANTDRFKGKWVETSGVYVPIGRRMINDIAILYAGTLVGPIGVPRFIVAEHGTLRSESADSELRVYRQWSFGPWEDKAAEALQHLSDTGMFTIDGDIHEGFPGEYYMRTGWRKGVLG